MHQPVTRAHAPQRRCANLVAGFRRAVLEYAIACADIVQQEVAERLGVSQAQVARIEKRGYDAYTLRTLQRYVKALGDQFKLEIAIQKVNGSGSLAESL